MIVIDIDDFGLQGAFAQAAAGLEASVRQGMEMTLESIAARARETPTFVDRTAALRNSIQSDGVEGSGLDLTGVVSFAATNGRGDFYGGYLEYGTRYIRERRFVRDAIDMEDGSLIESAIAAGLRKSGFAVGR
jgi:hypothetical protein